MSGAARWFGDTRVFNSLCLRLRGFNPKPRDLRFELLIGLAPDAIGFGGERRLGGCARGFGRLRANLVGVKCRLLMGVTELLGFADHARQPRLEPQLRLEPRFDLRLRASDLCLELRL